MSRIRTPRIAAAPERPGNVIRVAQQRARAERFVGREQELQTFADLLIARNLPRIVLIHGPGGIGKSSLLNALQEVAENNGSAVARLDARLLSAAPTVVHNAVDRSLSRLGSHGQHPPVLTLDHTEQWAALEGWLRTELLPGLPSELVVILAGRQKPAPEWHSDPGLRELLVEFALTPLHADAVATYLRRHDVGDDDAEAIQRFAHGHPLAMALATDHVLRYPGANLDLDSCSDLISTLVDSLLRDIDVQTHLEAIEACATVRRVDEPLLAAMLQRRECSDVYNWLAQQHFVERHGDGLVIHDLVRELVVRSLRERHLDRHHTLIRRAATHTLSGLESASQFTLLQAVGDTIYSLRHEPYVRQQFPFGDIACYPDTAATSEHGALADQVGQLEGKHSRAWFEHWLHHPSANLMVLRQSDGQPIAFALTLRFGATDTETAHDDPGVNAFFRHIRRHAPLREAEESLLVRFLMAHDTHQTRTPAWAHLAAQLNGLMFTPNLSLVGWASDLSYDWSGISEHADAHVLRDSEYEIDGRYYAITGHDNRREPPLEWARNSTERILGGPEVPGLQPAELALLQKTEFVDAVSQALRHFHCDETLNANPLRHSALLRRHASGNDADALCRMIEAVSARQLDDAHARHSPHTVLSRVYFHPGDKQHAVAHDLNISERTLRRRLRHAEAALADALWQLETNGDGA